ncbi:MAG: hypothetical protein EXQ85_00975, partial [Alphaproteobacteria bacterium]|nr:hypothetical protein [Alphaproteobacteria bacterium]
MSCSRVSGSSATLVLHGWAPANGRRSYNPCAVRRCPGRLLRCGAPSAPGHLLWKRSIGSKMAAIPREGAMTALETPRLRVYWQPHCSSCAFVKEYLTRHGVDHESINVLERQTAYDEMRQIGARSVPIVARGERFVYAQSIADVAAFVGIDAKAATLTPQQLIDRADAILAASARFVRQFPQAKLAELMPNRPNRTYRVLAHHAFNVVETFLEAVDGGVLTYETLTRLPPAGMETAEQIARYGDGVRQRLADWWRGWSDKQAATAMRTYYGEKPMREVLLRTASH